MSLKRHASRAHIEVPPFNIASLTKKLNTALQNGECQIFGKTNISYILIGICTCEYQGIRNVSFLKNLTCFVFL